VRNELLLTVNGQSDATVRQTQPGIDLVGPLIRSPVAGWSVVQSVSSRQPGDLPVIEAAGAGARRRRHSRRPVGSIVRADR
jgi:hypothetical protein